MRLQCKLFARDRALEACLLQDAAFIAVGAKGDHVSKIQMALFILNNNASSVSTAELSTQTFGPTTADAVIGFKTRLMNCPQNTRGSTVSRATIAALDSEMLKVESLPPISAARLSNSLCQ